MLTAKDGDLDEAEALDTGADDYLRKPFSFPVLVARVHALLRRAALGDPPPLAVGDLRLDLRARRVLRPGREVPLTAREFDLLAYLVRRAGQVVSKQEILAGVWDDDFEGDPNVVEVYVARLRRKLDDAAGGAPIETVRGAGYRVSRTGDRRTGRAPAACGSGSTALAALAVLGGPGRGRRRPGRSPTARSSPTASTRASAQQADAVAGGCAPGSRSTRATCPPTTSSSRSSTPTAPCWPRRRPRGGRPVDRDARQARPSATVELPDGGPPGCWPAGRRGRRCYVAGTPRGRRRERRGAASGRCSSASRSAPPSLAGIVWWLVGRALRPVEAIRAEVDAISASRLDRRVPGAADGATRSPGSPTR